MFYKIKKMKKTISSLYKLLEKEGEESKIKHCEDLIIDSIQDAIKEETFYALPTKEISKIIEKCEIQSVEELEKLVSNLSSYKGRSAALILNAIDGNELDLSECIRVISKLENSKICVRIGELYSEEATLVERDYDGDINQLQEKIKELEERGQVPRDDELDLDIFQASEDGILNRVKYFIETQHIDVNTKNTDGMTPLALAANSGRLSLIKYLSETCNAKVDETDNKGWTPLHFAASSGRLEVVKYLVDKRGADIKHQDSLGWNALHKAAHNNHFSVVKFLVGKSNSLVSVADNTGMAPLHYAAKRGNFDIVKFFINKCHATVDVLDKSYHSPLFYAVKYGTVDVIKFLVEECGADVYNSHASVAQTLDIKQYLEKHIKK